MIVTCPRCLTKFNLPGEKTASGAELQLHCSRCGWDFLFSPLDEDGLELKDDEVETSSHEDEFTTINDEVSDVALDSEELLDDTPSLDGDDMASEIVEDSVSDPVFELSDGDSDSDPDSDISFDEGLDFQGDAIESDAPGSSQAEDADQAVKDLALDLDDLNLDDIEFDDFGDEPDSKEEPEKSTTKRETTLDDDELDDLLEQVEGPSIKSEALTVASDRSDRSKEPAQPAPKSRLEKPVVAINTKRNFIMVFCCFLVLSFALWAGFGLWKRFSVDMKKHLKLVEVENQRLRLASDRVVIVIRGKVVNSSSKLVTDLKIKGILLDGAGKKVAEAATAGGVSFSEEELDRLDAAKLAMLENSAVTLAPDGGELPFMIAFYDYPEKARECYVELSSFKVKKGRRPK